MIARKPAALAALTISAVTLLSGVAHAELPTAPPVAVPAAQSAETINYTVEDNGESAVIATDLGALVQRAGKFEVVDPAGVTLVSVPLEVNIDDIVYPVRARIDGNRATLSPTTSGAYFHPVANVPKDIAKMSWEEREARAWAKLGNRLAVGSAIGALVGTVVGAPIGCLATLFAGCFPGALLGAAVGVLAGVFVIGVPIAIHAAIEYHTAINAPL